MLARSRGRDPAAAAARRGVPGASRHARSPGRARCTLAVGGWTARAGPRPRRRCAPGRSSPRSGEPGSGRATLLAQAAAARIHPRDRILVRQPAGPAGRRGRGSRCGRPSWARPDTAVIVRDVDTAAAVGRPAAARHHRRTSGRRTATAGERPAVTLTARGLRRDPAGPGHARRDGRAGAAAAGARPTTCCRWPGTSPAGPAAATSPSPRRPSAPCSTTRGPATSTSSAQVVRAAAQRTDVIDVSTCPPRCSASSGRRLSRLESFEREEIVRVLTRPAPRCRTPRTSSG